MKRLPGRSVSILTLIAIVAVLTACMPNQAIQYNAGAGSVDLEARRGYEDLVGILRDEATKFPPLVVTVQELCGLRFDQALAAAGSSGTAYDGRFFPTNPAGCGASAGGRGFGNAIFFRGTITATDGMAFAAQGAGEPRRIDCVDGDTDQGPLRVCTTHLMADRAIAEEQAAEALEFVMRLGNDRSRPTMVGGDFNLTPDSPALAPWFRQLREWGDNKPTFSRNFLNRKFDYLFASVDIAGKGTLVLPGRSDHLQVRSSISIQGR